MHAIAVPTTSWKCENKECGKESFQHYKFRKNGKTLCGGCFSVEKEL